MAVQSKREKYCSTCGQKLEANVCFSCDGSGTTGMWLWKQTCQTCGGTGRIFRCPDNRAHRTGSFRSSRSRQINLDFQAAKCPRCGEKIVYVNCTACGGKGRWQETIPGKWTRKDLNKNPFLPYYATPRPKTVFKVCPVCKGRGNISFCPTCKLPVAG